MKVILVENLLAAKTEDGIGLPNSDLCGITATDAAKTLANNWMYAIRDGESISHLVNDVDEVVSLLLTWKKAVLNTFA